LTAIHLLDASTYWTAVDILQLVLATNGGVDTDWSRLGGDRDCSTLSPCTCNTLQH